MTLQAGFEVGYAVLCLCLQGGGAWFFGVHGLVFGTVLAALLKTVAAVALTKPMWPSVQAPDIARIPPVVPAGWSVHAMVRNGFANSLEQVDVVLLNSFAGPAQTAIYKVAKSLASFPARIAGPIWMALRPHIFAAWIEGDRRTLARWIVIPSAAMLLTLMLVLVCLYWVLPSILAAVYGQSLVAAAHPTLILMLGAGLFSACTTWYRLVVLLEQRKWIGTALFGSTLFLAIVLGLLVGRSSALHMAIATSLSLLIATTLCWSHLLHEMSRRRSPRTSLPVEASSRL
jgi:O-antigen/teichoic acid export membrane protein